MNKNTIRMIQDLTNKVKELCMDCPNLNQKVDSIMHSRNKHMFYEEKQSPTYFHKYSCHILIGYPKLAKAYLSTIEDNFFCSPLTDKERKEAIFSCSKSSTIKYLPPSVNDQLQLQQKEQNRLIDLFVHQKLLNDPEISSELRTGTIYREMNFAENSLNIFKPKRQIAIHQLFSDSGFVQAQQTQATAPAAQSNNNPAANNQQSFLQAGPRQSQMESVDFHSGSPESEYRETKSFLEEKSSSILSRGASTGIRYDLPLTIHSHCYKRKLALEANKIQTEKKFSLLTNKAAVFCSSKENRKTQTSPQIEEAESTSRGKKLKNGDIANNMTIPVSSPAICSVSQPTYLHQNFAHVEYNSQSSNIQNQGLTAISIKTHKNRKNIFTWICKLYKKITSNFNSSSFRSLNSETHFRAQKQITSNIGYMDISIRSYKS
ncbi:hypothetical protein BB561_000565 [Smittium simulii]|uniref:Uncharacterized protein n=1 Tax=Smittium simulii TaxID=133385 RepID=A0A2T9YYU5_9FUNG|nr:hypothetical protein BB561_000565 [Smittium simulii]